MEIKGRTILVLGGYGLAGMAVCRQLMYEAPDTLIVSSLLEDEDQNMAISAIKNGSGTLFDPAVVDAFMEILTIDEE